VERLLTQNRELRAEGIWNWTLPAWAGRLPDGRTYNTCPAADACVKVCYARNGTYRFPAVRAKHERNLLRVLDDLASWEADMIAEVAAKQRRRAAGPYDSALHIRIHDAGDFFSDDYTAAWLRIARACPEVSFYAYTKEVERFRRLVEPDPPANFRWVYSLGGRQDDQVDLDRDRVADVFPDEAAIDDAGWSSQDDSDLLAVFGPRLVGIPANRIPGFNRRLAGRRFSEVQATPARERWSR
jgi:hypothetical protein